VRWSRRAGIDGVRSARSCLIALQLNWALAGACSLELTHVRSSRLSPATADMSMPSFRAVMRSLTAAFLLLPGTATDGRAHVSAHRHDRSHPGVAPANPSALRAATAQWQHVDTAPPQFLASEASLRHRRVQSASAPTRDAAPVCSCEHTTGQAARPPPFHA
jgi:hypothetical protein